MPLPINKSNITFKPREVAVVDAEHYPQGRVINPNLWADVSCTALLTFAQFKALPNELAKWDATNWLAGNGIASGWRYRLARIGEAKQFSDTQLIVPIEVEAQATAPITNTLSNVWAWRCPERDNFTIAPLPTHTRQQFSSGRGRVIGRYRGKIEHFTLQIDLTCLEFYAFLQWYQVLLRHGLPPVSVTWLANFSLKSHFRFVKPFEASRNDSKWIIKIEGVTCDNNL